MHPAPHHLVLNEKSRIRRIRNLNKIVIGNLNINSLPNKFEQLKDIVN